MKWITAVLTTGFIILLAITLATAQTSKKLTAEDFKTSATCGQCHAEIYDQWSLSTHAEAFRDPIYQTFLRTVSQKKSGRLNLFCVSCHAPLATMTDSVPEDLFGKGAEAVLLQEGVTCEFCHTISGSEVELKKLSLGAFLFPRSGQTEILYGRHADAGQEAHPTKRSSFLLSPELCGTCHRFGHPVSGKVIQDTYEEWKRSPYAAQGTRCQDCHMPAYVGKVAPGAKERPELHAHYFMGGRSALINKAASVIATARRSPTGLDVTVDIKNVAAGHLIPTGIPGIREMWVEVMVLGDERTLAREKRPIGLEILDGEGNPAMPWDAVRVGRDTRIGPQETRREQYKFSLAATNEVKVEAQLMARLISEQAAQYAGIDASPTIVMAQASVTVP